MSILSVDQYKMIRELPVKSTIENGYDWVIIEGKDGTKRMKVEDFLGNVLRDNLFFDNVGELSASESLTEGSIAYTKGFNKSGDGGAARYEVVYAPAMVTDGYTILPINSRTVLKAILSPDGSVRPEQIGATGDGNVDDTESIARLLKLDESVEFVSNKTYKITQNITIPNGKYIDFNGATLFLDKNATINIKNCENVTLRNLNVKCNYSGRGIYINKSKNIEFVNCKFTGIKENENAIEISDSSNIKVLDSEFTNTTASGKGLYIHGDTSGSILSDNISIVNCKFDNIKEAISVTGLVPVGNVTISNVRILYSNNNSGLVGIDNSVTSSDVTIDNLRIEKGYTGISVGSGSKSNISISNISATDVFEVYNISANKESSVLLGGNHIYSYSGKDTRYIFKNMNAKLFVNASIKNVGYTPLSVYTNLGMVTDYSDPERYMVTDKYTEDLSGTDGTLIIKDFRNCYIDISGDVDLSIINRGIEGQTIELVSSRGRKLKNISSNIVLLESKELTLHKYKGVKFVYINNKWTQIS